MVIWFVWFFDIYNGNGRKQHDTRIFWCLLLDKKMTETTQYLCYIVRIIPGDEGTHRIDTSRPWPMTTCHQFSWKIFIILQIEYNKITGMGYIIFVLMLWIILNIFECIHWCRMTGWMAGQISILYGNDLKSILEYFFTCHIFYFCRILTFTYYYFKTGIKCLFFFEKHNVFFCSVIKFVVSD